MTKTKTGIATILAAAAVLGFMYSTKYGKPARKREDPSSVTVVVSWTPSPRKPFGVDVRVAIDKKPQGDPEKPTTAPWVRSYPVRRGQLIEVWAVLLGEGDGFLGCNITTNVGLALDTDGKETPPGRVIHCGDVVS